MFSSSTFPEINLRVKKLVDYYADGSVKRFSEMIELSNSQKLNRVFNVDKRNGQYPEVSSDIILSIANMLPDVNTQWLLTGDGNMRKDNNSKVQIIHHPKYPEKKSNKAINLYDIAAAANLKSLFVQEDQNILGEIKIPDMPVCDGAVYVTGDSMYPLLKSGDIIAYKEIHNIQSIIYGEMYLVSFELDKDYYLAVKYINRSEIKDHVKLVSYNTYHDPKDIPLSSINALAIIKFSIRKNTMM